MTGSQDMLVLPEHFSGTARLFPLPGTVLFPHVMQPLHIFEPRYCEMLHDALQGDRLIAMAGLMPGWERDYDGRPPLYPVACLAKITSHQEQAAGRHNVLLLGVRRVQLIRELPATRAFREAEIALLNDEYPAPGAATRSARQQSLVAIFHRLTPNLEMPDPLEKLLATDLPLGALTDLMGYALDLSVPFKQQLLAEGDVDRRAALLLEHFRQSPREAPGDAQVFPPQFSHN
jgi:uncharacterized protein